MKLTTKLLTTILLTVLFLMACGSVDEVKPPAPGNGGSGGGGGGVSNAASALILTVSANSIPSSGSTIVTARVVDTLGNTVADGATVIFSFAAGDQLKARLSGSSATTTNGFASVTVTATATTDSIAVVKASCGNATGNISITITAAGGGGGGGGTVTLSANPTVLTSGGASATITATVLDSLLNPVSGATLNFSSNSAAGTLSPASVTTNTSGVATVSLVPVASASTSAVQVTVTASVSSLPGVQGTTTLTINPASTVPILTVSAAATSVLTNGTTIVSAILSGPLPFVVGSQTVVFTVSNASVAGLPTLSSVTVATDASGIAQVTLTAKTIASPVTVTASYVGQGRNLQGSTTITINAPPTDTITLVPNPPNIPVFGTATLTATVSGGGQPVPDGTTVNFILSDSTFGNLSNVTGSTVGGKATTTFSAASKPGTISISASAGNVSAFTQISISPAATGSIQFVSAVPQVIGIQSSGQPETSTVTFSVMDINGHPVADGALVNFAMSGPGGGAYIGSIIGSLTASASTINGSASVILHSGSTAGPVTIIATTTVSPGVSISTSAGQISIGGGVPSATHFMLATDVINLPGFVLANKTALISAYVADRFGNYNVLEGTAISFYAEAGAIDRNASTTKGAATAVFRTQAPMPEIVARTAAETTDIITLNSNYTAQTIPASDTVHPRNGLVTILSTVQGEESFLDANGDGLFTQALDPAKHNPACPIGYTCECHDSVSGAYRGSVSGGLTCAAGPGGWRSEGFLDLGEPFIDVNDSKARDDGSVSGSPFEQYIDANINGVYDPPNGMWDGPACTTVNATVTPSVNCEHSKMIWTTLKLAFTGSAVYCASSPYVAPPSAVTITYGQSRDFSFMVGDSNTNRISPGATIDIENITTNCPDLLTCIPNGTLTGQGTKGNTAASGTFTIEDQIPTGPVEIKFNMKADDPIASPYCVCDSSAGPCVPVLSDCKPSSTSIIIKVKSTDVGGCSLTIPVIFSP